MRGGPLASSVQVWDQLTFEPRDLVLEQQLALLEAFELQLVHMNVERQARDHLIEITMLDTQLPQLLEVAEQLTVDVVFDFRHGRTRCAARGLSGQGISPAAYREGRNEARSLTQGVRGR